jgi:hypothetical protein
MRGGGILGSKKVRFFRKKLMIFWKKMRFLAKKLIKSQEPYEFCHTHVEGGEVFEGGVGVHCG